MRQIERSVGYMVVGWVVLATLILVAIFATLQLAGANLSWPFQ
jgi:hypothetical protein